VVLVTFHETAVSPSSLTVRMLADE